MSYSSEHMESINVVAGIFIEGNRVFSARRAPGRSMAGKWEFVGGKIEDGETPEDALIREIREELGVACSVLGHFTTDITVLDELTIVLRCYLASFQSRPLVSSDHDEFKWLAKDELWDIDWAEADKPAVKMLELSHPLT